MISPDGRMEERLSREQLPQMKVKITPNIITSLVVGKKLPFMDYYMMPSDMVRKAYITGQVTLVMMLIKVFQE